LAVYATLPQKPTPTLRPLLQGVRQSEMKLIALLIMLSYSNLALSSGWHDYKLDIADDLSIMRANSFQVCLGRPNNSVLLCPDLNESNFGPIKAYILTNLYVFTEHYGVKPYEKNPTMLVADRDVLLYFITERVSGASVGPMSYEEFVKNENVSGSLEWVFPENPDKWTPFIGTVMFLGFTLLFYGWPLIVIWPVCYFIYKVIKKRKNA